MFHMPMSSPMMTRMLGFAFAARAHGAGSAKTRPRAAAGSPFRMVVIRFMVGSVGGFMGFLQGAGRMVTGAHHPPARDGGPVISRHHRGGEPSPAAAELPARGVGGVCRDGV